MNSKSTMQHGLIACLTFFLLFGVTFIVSAQETENKTLQEVRTEEYAQTKFQEKTDAFVDAIPDSVKEKTTRATRGIEQYRIDQATALARMVDETKTDISLLDEAIDRDRNIDELIEEQQNEGETANTGLKKAVAHIKLVGLQILYFIFNTKVVFYVVSSLLLLLLLRSILSRLRRGNAYDS